MLSKKPLNLEAIVGLLLGAFICLSLGSVLVSTWHYTGPGGRDQLLYFSLSFGSAALLVTAIVIISKGWVVRDFLPQLLIMLACLSTGLACAAWAQKIGGRASEVSSGEQMVVAEAAVLLFFIGFLRAQRLSWSEAFGLPNRPRHAILLGVAAACIFLPVGEGLQWVSAKLMTHFRVEPQEQQAVHALRVTSTWSNRAVLGILALILAPVVEEVFFRGVLYPSIKQAGFPRLALWGVSLLFACVHFNLVSFVPLFMLAILLTVIYEYTDNLLAPIAAHALFNALNFVLLYLFE